MDTIINNSRAPAQTKGNRYYQVFTPKTAQDLVQLAHMGCIGDTSLSNIQVEKGSEPTPYVAPKITESTASGIFSALQGLRVEMRDKESSLWSEIIANNKAMLLAYHDKEVSASLGITADQIRQEIKDTLDGKSTSLTQNLNGFQQRVQDNISKSTVTQLSTLYDRKFEAVNGNVSQLTQTVDGLKSRLTNVEGKSSELTQTVDGLRSRVESAEGKASEASQTVNGFRQTVQGLNDTYSTWTQTVNGFRQDLQGVNGNYSSLSQTVSGLQSTVGNSSSGLVSKVTQLQGLIEQKVTKSDVEGIIRNSGDMIALAVKGKVSGEMSGTDIINKINVTTGGVGVYSGNNKLVVTPNTTYIQDGTIKNAMIESLTGGKITAGTITSSHIATNAIEAQHLKVDQAFFNKLMANEAYLQQLFAKSAFINQVQAVTLSASKISGGLLQALNGAMGINLNSGQILYYTDQAALKRIISDRPTQFLKFATGTYNGYSCGVTVFGSNRINGSENSDDGAFAGLRIWNGSNGSSTFDSIDMVADQIYFQDSSSGVTRSPLILETYRPNSTELRLYPSNMNSRTYSLGTPTNKFKDVYTDNVYTQGVRIAMALKDLALKIGYAGNDGWANRIG